MDTPLEMNVSIDCIKNLVDNKNYEEALALCTSYLGQTNKKRFTYNFFYRRRKKHFRLFKRKIYFKNKL